MDARAHTHTRTHTTVLVRVDRVCAIRFAVIILTLDLGGNENIVQPLNAAESETTVT